MKASKAATAVKDKSKHRHLSLSMGIAASLAIAGLAWVGVQKSFLGACLTLAGMIALMWTIHLYGRLGPDG